jgi:hypothetical protein
MTDLVFLIPYARSSSIFGFCRSWLAFELWPCHVCRMFSLLCRDDIPMVRKAACSALGAFARVVESSALHDEIIPWFTKLSEDDQDSVRIVSVDNCVALGNVLSPEQTATQIL